MPIDKRMAVRAAFSPVADLSLPIGIGYGQQRGRDIYKLQGPEGAFHSILAGNFVNLMQFSGDGAVPGRVRRWETFIVWETENWTQASILQADCHVCARRGRIEFRSTEGCMSPDT